MLLFGQPISRIHRLHRDDLNQTDDTLTIGFGDPPTPVPEPLASLLRQLAASAHAVASCESKQQAKIIDLQKVGELGGVGTG